SARYSIERCTQSTALRLSLAGTAPATTGCVAGGAPGAASGRLRQPARARAAASSATARGKFGEVCKRMGDTGCERIPKSIRDVLRFDSHSRSSCSCDRNARPARSPRSPGRVLAFEEGADGGEAVVGALLLALRVGHGVGAVALQLGR